MKAPRKLIHIVKHKPTGAHVPIEIIKTDENNVIQEFKEHTHNRKGFTLQMLSDRWDMSLEDALKILQTHEVPGHLSNSDFMNMAQRRLASKPADVAVFFAEYIYAIERKTKMPHNKLKPRLIEERK
jgi:hypothetical protein